jgi:hypothetical protein
MSMSPRSRTTPYCLRTELITFRDNLSSFLSAWDHCFQLGSFCAITHCNEATSNLPVFFYEFPTETTRRIVGLFSRNSSSLFTYLLPVFIAITLLYLLNHLIGNTLKHVSSSELFLLLLHTFCFTATYNVSSILNLQSFPHICVPLVTKFHKSKHYSLTRHMCYFQMMVLSLIQNGRLTSMPSKLRTLFLI